MNDLTRRLADYVGDDRHQTRLETCTAEATALVDQHTAGATVPGTVRDRAVLECAAELYNRADAPNGIKSFAEDGTTVRVARDPMVAARPLLAPFLGPVAA